MVGVSGTLEIRSPAIETSTFTSSRQGRISCNVVLMTSASPEASVLQSSASKAASEPHSKPFTAASALVTCVGVSTSPKWPSATSFSMA